MLVSMAHSTAPKFAGVCRFKYSDGSLGFSLNGPKKGEQHVGKIVETFRALYPAVPTFTLVNGSGTPNQETLFAYGEEARVIAAMNHLAENPETGEEKKQELLNIMFNYAYEQLPKTPPSPPSYSYEIGQINTKLETLTKQIEPLAKFYSAIASAMAGNTKPPQNRY